MCIICLELEKLTTLEASRNLREVASSLDKEHIKEVVGTIASRELDNFGSNNLEEEIDTLQKSLDAFTICGEILSTHVDDSYGEDFKALSNDIQQIIDDMK